MLVAIPFLDVMVSLSAGDFALVARTADRTTKASVTVDDPS